MVNFGPPAAEIVSLVWGTQGNFNGFRVLAALLHDTLVVGVSQTAALNRGRQLYSAGRPSRWALAHILVLLCICLANSSRWHYMRTKEISSRALHWYVTTKDLTSYDIMLRMLHNLFAVTVIKVKLLSDSFSYSYHNFKRCFYPPPSPVGWHLAHRHKPVTLLLSKHIKIILCFVFLNCSFVIWSACSTSCLSPPPVPGENLWD